MQKRWHRITLAAVLIFILLTLSGCAAGPTRFVDHPAGFLAGVWHGFIIVVAFIIGLFTDSVQIYARNNTGALYDLGFVLGIFIMLGGSGGRKWKKKCKKKKEREWDEIGARVEEKVRKGIKSWLEESGEREKEWTEIGKKIEEKIKRELRDWAES
jgi:hypothetical protein